MGHTVHVSVVAHSREHSRECVCAIPKSFSRQVDIQRIVIALTMWGGSKKIRPMKFAQGAVWHGAAVSTWG